MKVGFDYWKTISHHRGVLSPLIKALIAQGHEVVVISAAGKNRQETTPRAFYDLGLPESVKIEMVIWEGKNHLDAPRLKYEKCKELGIQLFFDDRADTCKYLSERGIPAFQAPFYKFFEKDGWDLLSGCCGADFDPFGYEKEEGIWQERCLKCGEVCEPVYQPNLKKIS